VPVASRHTFVPIPVCDGQTDEQTQDDSIGLLRASIESRCKRKKNTKKLTWSEETVTIRVRVSVIWMANKDEIKNV